MQCRWGEELDKLFLHLHNELFENYDCNGCRNCCKQYYGSIPAGEITRDAGYLNMEVSEFMDTYLVNEKAEENYRTKHKPCDFLEENGVCKLGECKPESCEKFPYTNQPGRLESLYSILDAVEVCPVAFEIFERLKQEYHFLNEKT